MSTVADIITRTTALVDSLSDLIATDTVQALPGVAEELGVTDILNAGIDALVTALDALNGALQELDGVLDHVAAFGAMLGVLEPLVGALGRMIGESGQEFAQYGLDEVVAVTGPIASGFGYAETALAIAGKLVVDPERFAELVSSLAGLRNQFAALAVAPAAEAQAA